MEMNDQFQTLDTLPCGMSPGTEQTGDLAGHRAGVGTLEVTKVFPPAGNQTQIPRLASIILVTIMTQPLSI
jgi:hypothetical protein